jgi:carboxypeptidase Q
MRSFVVLSIVSALSIATRSNAQTFRSDDPVIKRMWQVGIEQSQVERTAQVLIDSIGPRLSGTPGFAHAVTWLENTYMKLGIPARREQYGTWRGWQQGVVHMQLTAPRVQNLEVELLAWSPGTPKGNAVEGEAVVIPALADSAAGTQWLKSVKGKFVLISAPELMCRAPQELERFARPSTITKLTAQRAFARKLAADRLNALAPAGTVAGERQNAVVRRLELAGVIGIGTTNWSGGWGVNKIFGAVSERVPSLDLSCEDYGLVHRLASNQQGPRIRFAVEAQATPAEVPMFNVVAQITGSELPNEYGTPR